MLLLELFVVFDENGLHLRHLALPVLDAFGHRVARQLRAVLLDFFALFLQVLLLLIELALTLFEELLERCLCPEPILRFHHGALGIDHCDSHLCPSRG